MVFVVHGQKDDMMEVNNKARGLVLRQSLLAEELPNSLRHFVVNTHDHLLGGKKSVEVLILECEGTQLLSLVDKLSRMIKKSGFYAHFIVASSLMYVVFPFCIVSIQRDNPATAELARKVGALFNIPQNEMKFEQLFEVDHPNV